MANSSEYNIWKDWTNLRQKVNRNVRGMPQSQTAANPRHQEEEKKDKNIHAQNKQTNVREAQRPAPSSPSEVIRMLKQTEKQRQRAWEDFKTLSAPWYKPQSYTELRTTFYQVREMMQILNNAAIALCLCVCSIWYSELGWFGRF